MRVVHGMLDNRSNAYGEAMNGLLQQAKRAARASRVAGLGFSRLNDRFSVWHHENAKNYKVFLYEPISL